MKRIQGLTAVITGAAGGIGSAAARRFAAEGANIMLVDRDKAAVKGLSGEFPGDQVAYFAGDVADEQTMPACLAQSLDRFGRVDIALLNAGIEGDLGRIEDMPVAMFDRVMAVNVRSVWLGLAALMPVMRESGGGSIVITSSVAGLRGSANLAAYSASKHAVLGLMRSAALEGAGHRVRVNAVNPAQTQTRMMEAIDSFLVAAGRTDDPASRIPIGRYADPSEVAAIMLFLASEESRFCTGATYLVDGGSMT